MLTRIGIFGFWRLFGGKFPSLDGSVEGVEQLFAGRVRTGRVGARPDACLGEFHDAPVLAVGQIPEIDRVISEVEEDEPPILIPVDPEAIPAPDVFTRVPKREKVLVE